MQSIAAGSGSRWRRGLLLILFAVLLIDLLPGFGIGIVPGLSAKNLLLYIVILTIATRAVTRPRGVIFSDMDVHAPYLLLIIYALLMIVLHSVFSPTYNTMRGVITLKNQVVDLFLFMLAFRYGLDSRQDYLRILRFVVVTMLIISFLTLIDFLNIPDLGLIGTHHGRIEGPFGSANQYGALLAFLIPIAIVSIKRDFKKWQRVAWQGGVLISIALLLATGSRGAFVSAVLGSILGVYLLRHHLNMRQVRRYALVAAAVLFGLVIIFSIANADLLLERFEKSTTGNIHTVSSGRIEIWTAAFLIMLEWPMSFLVGNGWNSFEDSGIWKSAHNEYVDRWYELGIIGLAMFVWLLRTITTRLRRRVGSADPELRAILIGYVFSLSIVCVNIFFSALPDIWTVIWVITGLVMGLQASPALETPISESNPNSPKISGVKNLQVSS